MRFNKLISRVLLFCLALIVGGRVMAAEPWPREITTQTGSLRLLSPPQRIVSTSVTLTGSLLSLNAPLIGTGTGLPNQRLTDKQGFFKQWSDIAQQRQLPTLYHGTLNLEAIAMARPDLIVVSATGGDSALSELAQLQKIAPVLVINYTDKSWQQIVKQLGQVLGKEIQAQQLIQNFTQQVAQIKSRIHLPAQPVSAMVWNGLAQQINLWSADSAQGKLLQQLGFELAPLPNNLIASSGWGKRRQDIVQLAGEMMITGITGKSWLLFASDEQAIAQITQQPLLKDFSAVKQHRIYALGEDNFRLDYYSATRLLDRINQLFGEQKS